jgi:hypothetical protein
MIGTGKLAAEPHLRCTCAFIDCTCKERRLFLIEQHRRNDRHPHTLSLYRVYQFRRQVGGRRHPDVMDT